MNLRSQAEDKISLASCPVGASMVARTIVARTTVAMLLLVAAGFPVLAQQSSQQTGSLADVARQARAQKQAQPAGEKSQAQQVADQLAEDQDDKDAPAGFRTYNAGDYKLWVPAPYTVAGNDAAGVVLSGAGVGNMRAQVLVGNPMVLKFGQNEDAFREAATQFAHTYLQSAKCAQATIANHNAYQCDLAGANLLGHPVSGQAVVIKGSSNIFPVMCVAPTDSRARDVLNSPTSSYSMKRSARLALEREDQELRTVWQKCESVLKSIHLKEDSLREGVLKTGGAQQAPSIQAGAESAKPADLKAETDNPAPAPAQSASAPAASAAPAANASGPPSLADIARRLHEGQGQQAAGTPIPAATAAAQTTVPAGLKVHSFNYCKTHTQCWDASVFIPVEAQLVSSDCKQYVFEVKVQGAPFLLLAGPGGDESCTGRAANDPSLVRWNQLVAPETARAPGTASTISSQQAALDGKSAVITTMGFKKGLADWIGKRAEIDANGVQVVVGCMAPREHFADGDAICSSMLGSLRLP